MEVNRSYVLTAKYFRVPPMIEHSQAKRVLLPKRGSLLDVAEEATSHSEWVVSMAERIGSLPGLSCAPASDETPDSVRRFVFDNPGAHQLSGCTPNLFLVLDAAGRMTFDARPAIRKEILRSGWGEGHADGVTTFAPRDEIEVAVLWRILLMAYFDARDSQAGRSDRAMRRQNRVRAVDGARSILTSGTFY